MNLDRPMKFPPGLDMAIGPLYKWAIGDLARMDAVEAAVCILANYRPAFNSAPANLIERMGHDIRKDRQSAARGNA